MAFSPLACATLRMVPMSNCPHIYELQALADEQSSASERRRLSDHVARCARCAEALRELECARLPLHLLAE